MSMVLAVSCTACTSANPTASATSKPTATASAVSSTLAEPQEPDTQARSSTTSGQGHEGTPGGQPSGAPASTAGEFRRGALITPAEVSPGARFTIEPAAAIQPLCGLPLILSKQGVAGPFALLYEDGTLLEYGRDSFALPDCLPAASDDTRSFPVPADLSPGTYVACLGAYSNPNGCGDLTIL